MSCKLLLLVAAACPLAPLSARRIGDDLAYDGEPEPEPELDDVRAVAGEASVGMHGHQTVAVVVLLEPVLPCSLPTRPIDDDLARDHDHDHGHEQAAAGEAGGKGDGYGQTLDVEHAEGGNWRSEAYG